MGTLGINATAALTKLTAVTIDGSEYPTFRDERGREVMTDLDIGRALEISRPRDIRRVIVKHLPELGEVSRAVSAKPHGPDGGRPEDCFYLTEEQALFIAAKCRTKAATAQLKRLIAVYMAARQGNAAAAVAMAGGIPPAPENPRWSGGDDSLEIAEQLLAAMKKQRQAQRELEAKQAQLAEQQTELARQQAMQAIKVDEQTAKVNDLLAAQQAAEMALRSPVGPVLQLPPISRRTETNRIVRAYCQATGDYRGGWNRLLTEHRDRFHIDLKARAKIRKVAPAVIAEELGRWDHLHALAVELFCKPERVGHA